MKKSLAIIMTLILLLNFNFFANKGNKIKAEEEKEVRIHFVEKLEDGTEKFLEAIEIHIWKITDEIEIKELDKLSIEELKAKYGEEKYIVKSNKDGLVVLENLEDGKYYVREISTDINKKQAVPIIFTVPFESGKNDIFVKFVDRKPKGEYNFKKISSKDGKSLKDAVFKVVKKNGEYFEDVLKDGKIYIVKSDENGEFKVKDMEVGKYYLWEVNAPKGYKALKEPIEFEITEEISKIQKQIQIQNKPFSPPKIPDTGDILFVTMLIGGITLFLTGYLISRKQTN